MTIRNLFGNALASVGVGLCILTVVLAAQQDADAAICTGCTGCSATTIYLPDGTIICSGVCLDTSAFALCDDGCGCKPNPSNSGCNCSPP